MCLPDMPAEVVAIAISRELKYTDLVYRHRVNEAGGESQSSWWTWGEEIVSKEWAQISNTSGGICVISRQ